MRDEAYCITEPWIRKVTLDARPLTISSMARLFSSMVGLQRVGSEGKRGSACAGRDTTVPSLTGSNHTRAQVCGFPAVMFKLFKMCLEQ